MSVSTVVLFVLGLVLLVGGAEALVRGASQLALAVGISPLVVGLTIVAMGTSSPELAVSVSATRGGRTDLAIGNVVGSNIVNVLLILGTCALFRSLLISWRVIRLEVPIMIAASVAVWLLVLDGRLARWESAMLFAALVLYVGWAIRASRRETAAAQEMLPPGTVPSAPPAPWWVNVGLVLIGLGLLVLGSNWMVDGAVEFATELGLSELVIGLTIVSVGTSLPELATSVLATMRGEREIAVGNVVGSNIFNLLGVLGLSGLVAKGALLAGDSLRSVDVPVMLVVTAVCLPVFFSAGNVMHRWEGGLFVASYGVYVTYLILRSSDAGAPQWFVDVARFGAAPAAVVLVTTIAWRDRHHPSHDPERASRAARLAPADVD